MSNTFPHSSALLISVGQASYAPWSLAVTVRDDRACRAILRAPARGAGFDGKGQR